MFIFFSELSPIYQALLAGIFTFLITVLGSSLVFFFKSVNKNIMDIMLSLSAGIMLSASFFSLLNPAINISNELKLVTWLVIFSGFISGGILLLIGDKILNYLDKRGKKSISKLKRSIMLFSSITLHNIPEGLVLGVAYGSIIYNFNSASLASAIALTIGIGIQNFPEGSAISLPMKRDGLSCFKSFIFGSISAIVEPIFALLGALLVLKIQVFLPFVLSFTAGAMVFVITMELIPESQTNKRKDLMALFLMLGFSIMMILELVL
ncbi:MAG: ZIP family metal transporter [Bacilli bacterium]|nr:ZIP family metal transporter [Bacilli bacterium]